MPYTRKQNVNASGRTMDIGQWDILYNVAHIKCTSTPTPYIWFLKSRFLNEFSTYSLWIPPNNIHCLAVNTNPILVCGACLTITLLVWPNVLYLGTATSPSKKCAVASSIDSLGQRKFVALLLRPQTYRQQVQFTSLKNQAHRLVLWMEPSGGTSGWSRVYWSSCKETTSSLKITIEPWPCFSISYPALVNLMLMHFRSLLAAGSLVLHSPLIPEPSVRYTSTYNT